MRECNASIWRRVAIGLYFPQLLQAILDPLQCLRFQHPPDCSQRPNERAAELMIDLAGFHLPIDDARLGYQAGERGEGMARVFLPAFAAPAFWLCWFVVQLLSLPSVPAPMSCTRWWRRRC